MTLRDRVIIMLLVLGMGLYGGYKLLWLPATAKIVKLEQTKAEVKGLATDISPLLKQTDTLQNEEKALMNKVSEVKGTGGLTLTKEEFLLCLGEATTKNNVNLIGFNDLGTQNEDGIYKAIFDFELQGSANSINKIFQNIDNIGIKYSVGSVSYRQVAEFDYLRRFFDNITGLPWYKEVQKKEEEILPDAQTPDLSGILGVEIPSIPDLTPPPIQDTLPNTQTPTPTPEPVPEQESTPTEPPKDKNINDRLDSLLEKTSSVDGFQIKLLTNTEEPENFDAGSEMRLAVTICFIMFEEPSSLNSFRNNISTEEV